MSFWKFFSSIDLIIYFRVPHNTLRLLPKFCIDYSFQMLPSASKNKSFKSSQCKPTKKIKEKIYKMLWLRLHLSMCLLMAIFNYTTMFYSVMLQALTLLDLDCFFRFMSRFSVSNFFKWDVKRTCQQNRLSQHEYNYSAKQGRLLLVFTKMF